jgi:hypothetical protein
MSVLIEVAVARTNFPTYFVAVYVVGFLAAVTIGSIAWYNSKRPVGWEEVKKPDFLPEVKTQENLSDS